MIFRKAEQQNGFTIIELLIIIVVIAVLAAIIIVSYNGVVRRTHESTLKSDLQGGISQVLTKQVTDGALPTDTSMLKMSDSTNTSYRYNNITGTFCLAVSSTNVPGTSYHTTEAGGIQDGDCPPATIQNGSLMQVVTTANCPATRTMVVDARDSHTYWIQKLADGKCWMLTDIAYGGGGVASYNDTRTVQDGTADSMGSYTEPKFYIAPGSNPTTVPTQPSTTTDGGATNPQYGYYYNWCAATGGQLATSGCANATSPLPDPTISICPSGWRLPTGGDGGEFSALTTALGVSSDTAGSTIMHTVWLAQRPGNWYNGVQSTPNFGLFWSGTQYSAGGGQHMGIGSSSVNPLGHGSKNTGFVVRCVTA